MNQLDLALHYSVHIRQVCFNSPYFESTPLLYSVFIVCTNGNVHTTCGSNCPLTCENKDNPPSCIQECVEGCFCPSGMYSNAGTCVSSENCPDSKILINHLSNCLLLVNKPARKDNYYYYYY